MWWKDVKANFATSPKSTINGLLIFGAVTAGVFIPFVPPTASRLLAGLAMVQALCRAWIGMGQLDPGKQLAFVPNEQDPVVVPSHETPDSPLAIPVKEKN